MRLRLLLLALLLTGSACMVRFIDPDEDEGPPPHQVHAAEPVAPQGAPPPATVVMTREEAAHAALGYAQSQGYGARLLKVKWHAGRYWRVDVEVWRGTAGGRMRLEYDAYARTMTHATAHVRERHHGHRDDDDDDDDD